MDCVFETIANKMNRLSYDIIALSNGISNEVQETPYANEKVRVVSGRGYNNSLVIYDELEIPYEKIDVNEFFHLSSFDDLIIFTSKDMLVSPQNIKPNIRQLSFWLSSFYCESISLEKTFLGLYGLDEKFELSVELAHKIMGLDSIPEYPMIYIIRLLDKDYEPSHEIVINNAIKKLKNCLVDTIQESDKRTSYSGPQFYQRFIEIVEDFVNIGPQKTKKDIIEQQLFIGSLNSGGRGFYRQDFYRSLEYIKEWNDIDLEREANQLKICNHEWNKIGKILRQHQSKTDYVDVNSLKQIKNAMSVIQENELAAISKIVKKIKEGID